MSASGSKADMATPSAGLVLSPWFCILKFKIPADKLSSIAFANRRRGLKAGCLRPNYRLGYRSAVRYTDSICHPATSAFARVNQTRNGQCRPRQRIVEHRKQD
jgi:hypothetical protein